MFKFGGIYNLVRRAVCIGVDDMVKGKFFYAVRKGIKPGVYTTWDECKAQVDKFPSASYKKFGSEKDAWAFVRSRAVELTSTEPEGSASCHALLPRRGPEPIFAIPLGRKRPCEDDADEDSTAKRVKQTEECFQNGSSSQVKSDGFTYMGDAVVVYTDGSCSGNGKSSARAGLGVYWGPDHPLNAAERLQGRQTNQRAEIQAACKALEQALDMNVKKLVVYTDSKFTINGVTSWVKSWKLNGWRLKSGGPIINKEDFEKLDELNKKLEVVWLHIPGHSGYPGNDEADRLSREGAAKPLP